MLATEKLESILVKGKEKTELEIEGDLLKIRCQVLEEMLPCLAEEVQINQKHCFELKNAIIEAENEKESLLSTLHWETQSRVQRECDVLGLELEISHCKEELAKTTQVICTTKYTIEQRMTEVQELHTERVQKFSQLSNLISSREEELSRVVNVATHLQLTIIQKKQELDSINEKIECLHNQIDKKSILQQIENDLNNKYNIYIELQKDLIERETRNSVFKIRANFIDGRKV